VRSQLNRRAAQLLAQRLAAGVMRLSNSVQHARPDGGARTLSIVARERKKRIISRTLNFCVQPRHAQQPHQLSEHAHRACLGAAVRARARQSAQRNTAVSEHIC
jgi:hypothetical protein